MKLKNLALIIPSFLICGIAYGAVTSCDNIFVQNDQYSYDFTTKLNQNFDKVLTGGVNNIEAANIKNDTISEADMADDANPRIRTKEGASCELVVTGLLPATDTDLTTDTSAGTAYPMGYRVNKASTTSHTYTASKWTYVDIDSSGNFQYSEVAIAGATPAVAANSIRLARVSSDATQVLAVQDLRTTSCATGPFSILKDATGEASLSDLLVYGNGFENGLAIKSIDATTVSLGAGSAYINGEYRANTTALTINSATTASGTTSISGLDTGSLAANTTYYVFGVADEGGVDDITGVLSASSSSPSGMTNYRRLGEIATHASSASFATADAVSIAYMGNVRQVKSFQSGAVETGTTVTPADDSIPQYPSEANVFYTLKFTPTSATNVLYIDGLIYAASAAGGTITVAVYVSPYVGAFIVGAHGVGDANTVYPIPIHGKILAGTTSEITIRVSVGSAGTTTVNGATGSRLYGGKLISSIKVTEVEP